MLEEIEKLNIVREREIEEIKELSKKELKELETKNN